MGVILFTKVKDVKLPHRGHSTDAGIDFFVPKFDEKFINDLKEKNPLLFFPGIHDGSIIKYDKEKNAYCISLLANRRVLIPSGIHCRMEEPNRALIAFNKSGVASRLGLVAGAAVVDYEYQGEIHINVINTSTTEVRIYEDMKLMQFIELPIYTSEVIEVEDLNTLYEVKSVRGAGGFGSTGV